MIRQTIKEISLLLILSALAATVSYASRDHGLYLFSGSASSQEIAAATKTGPVLLTFEEASEMFGKANVLFVDARDNLDYDMGHIPGAVSIPLHEAQSDPGMVESLPREKRLIVYCSDVFCKKAEKLVAILMERTYSADIFPDGYLAWEENGLKIEETQ